MTNFERWQSYTSGLSSPQNFVDWTYRYIISAALQRRVWIGSPFSDPAEEHQACFPNVYIILVGPPGTGKGLVIREASNFLKFWKLKDAIKITNNGHITPPEIQQTIDAIHDKNLQEARELELQCKNKQNSMIEPLLIPMAADATTYEALVEAVAQSYRRINFIKPDNKLGIYGHSSLCFSLQELGSLLRKRTNDTVNYMLGLYDCPVDYEYKTKTQGQDRVRRGCLNLLAGTTPSFMQSVFNEELIDEGFSSRSFFIFAPKNRKAQFFIPPLTAEQLEHRKVLLDHIRKLASLYGCVRIDKETHEFLEDWWKSQETDRTKRSNQSAKLAPYYSRKNIHIMKVAMQIHFGESIDMHIPLATYKEAIAVTDKEEKNMHLAITLEGSNPLNKISRKVISILENGEQNFVELHSTTFEMANRQELEDALSFLVETEQVETRIEENKITGKTLQVWKLKSNR